MRTNAAVILIGAALCGFTLAVSAETADTIYHNGTILTIDDARPRAEAVAVKDGKILAVGAKDEVLKTKGDGSKVVDLGGRTMLPGFVDAHGHMMGGGLQALSANLLAPPDGEVKDIASLQQTLREWMSELGARVYVAGTFFGKWKTTLQIIGISLMLYRHDLFGLPTYDLGLAFLLVAAGLTLWSMVDYLRAAWPIMSGGD